LFFERIVVLQNASALWKFQRGVKMPEKKTLMETEKGGIKREGIGFTQRPE
jgi:hypothetical protein